MEYSTIHSIFTVVLFVGFISFVIWAYSKKRKTDFDKAANLVFDDEQTAQQKTKQESDHE
ncbi:cbb3-type cytochrome oxidase subunit 3 [Rheinheimera baltica]|uniref:Cbb3-type cytochrome c oxidase subunit 3 n=1 Tax=Rheinheimera baltica TaxID=67576 RepID=A0ABT9HWS0_9GAMM|nr:cbb3-type cytochrome c oxidase subunit 3 [Rheinheimera baltica]MDP5135578.1 cbb3-type cytochrome c oxidase subunit 3 [Rheinheimera baltica]MDP5143356.1 cbb3-type cytochrome c oxidase subunit 3 [Rheinheimera baltica]MDP5151193.1 cbb3-type cytochrome c oxidase subunit 3 [Rheinheimera baltica]MDP5191185.1 cbb3-type cytochrome c oxidase subunit 3 [Rheinheimera baltica]